jgi:hypothetical protein
MARRRKIANTVADPTLKTTEIEIKGKKYTLCFDMGSLAEAELYFRRAGEQVNLLAAFPEVSLSSVLVIFPCAIRKFHPELSFKQAQEIIGSSLPAIYAVAPFIMQAWRDSMPEADPDAPKTEPPPLP